MEGIVPIATGLGDPGKIKVLLYHRINRDGDGNGSPLCVDASTFRRQITFLEQWGFTPITFDDYLFFLEGELNLPRKPVIITFDDGYRDVYDIAFPILQEFGMKAVVFVVADSSVRTNVWTEGTSEKRVELMDQSQIVELHAAGFEIGSHTLTHAKLPSIPKAQAWKEISYSRIVLETLLNNTVKSFAYPYGAVSPETKRMVEEAGYVGGFTGWTGPVSFGADHHEIRRIPILRSVGVLGFGARLLTSYERYRRGVQAVTTERRAKDDLFAENEDNNRTKSMTRKLNDLQGIL